MGSNRRSIVLEGKVTSLMLEPSFWRHLDFLAESQGTSWAEFTRIALAEIGPTDNRAAAIKEYLLSQALDGSGLQSNSSASGVLSCWETETGQHRRFESRFSATLTVGRASTNGFRLADDECSRFHAALLRVDGRWWAVDLASKNGTRINGRRISRSELGPGQWLELGNSRLRLLEGQQPLGGDQ